MAKQRTIQILRGTTAQNNAYTGAAGELTMDTTTNEVRIHDNATAGGHTLAKKSDINNATLTIQKNGTTVQTFTANASSNVTANITVPTKISDLTNDNISNCITEIPQDIKLELNNGTLTLKAGSKVYVPNGSGVFDVVNITTDKTTTASVNGKWMYFINESGNLQRWAINDCFSGTTAPTSVHYPMWYDTTNNAIKSSDDYGSTWSGKFSLPIAIVTVSNGAISSIDQIFNGFGYIGSTVFALSGIKGLASYGRNADGTLKNVERTTTGVSTISSSTTGTFYVTINSSGAIAWSAAVSRYVYDESTNWIIDTQTGAANTNPIVAIVTLNSGSITSFEPKTPFHAVDYNDLSTVALSGAYNDLIGKPTDLFDVKWSDHLLDNTSWLRADNFSWNSGVTYSVAYNHLVADIAGKTLQSETISGTTVQFYLANDGHKICPASEESNVAAIYAATGVAWYYIIDSANTRFKLPRTKFGFTGIRSGVGNYIAPALPNHTHDVAYRDAGTTGGQFNGVGGGSYFGDRTVTSGGASDSTYQNGATVQPPATQMYLYSYVGTFTQTALENTAGLNASLFNGKADVNLLNTTSNVDFVIESQEPTAENDYTWYRKYKSGWVEQGGISVAIGDYETTTITLPVAMSNINYTLTFGNGWNGTNDDGAYIGAYCERLPNRTTTSFQLYGRGATQRKISFVVSGKAA